MNRLHHLISLSLFTALILLAPGEAADEVIEIERAPRIDPDYSDLVIPSNIAPLNFTISEPGGACRITFKGSTGTEFTLKGKKGNVIIPERKWRELLKSEEIRIIVQMRDPSGKWIRFTPLRNRVAPEKIDSHLVYRIIDPAYKFWNVMGIYQRNLENYNEKPVLVNRLTDRNCMNCHNFADQDPDKMIFHMRGGAASSTMMARNGEIVSIDTKTEFNKPGAYPAWHPGGELLAFSVNKLTMFYHTCGESRDVLDLASDLIVYKIPSNTVSTDPAISDPDRLETFPNWAPDGKHLYFCSAPSLESFITSERGAEDLDYERIDYDLVRIPYDAESDTWGEIELLLSAREMGKSMTMPRVSPDGRYLLFCIADYGNFPIYLRSSDLCMLDLDKREVIRPDVNSDLADTFHSWSSNSRWFVFSSKRRDGVCARPYFAYVDENGCAHKPFLLPQKDPAYYKTYLKTYNVPEMVTGPVTANPRDLVEVAYDVENRRHAKLDPRVKLRERVERETPAWQSHPQ